MGQNRLLFIDIAKGIGIILVVCSHTEANILMLWSLGFFVPIFYFCSGYTTSTRSLSQPITQYMKKRTRKLLCPYIFFNILLFLYFRRWSINGLYGVLYSRYCLFPIESDSNYQFLIWGNYPMWFITSLLVSYFIQYYNNNYYKVSIILIYFCLTYILSYVPILLPWSIDTAFLSAVIMYAGFNANKYNIISWPTHIILICIMLYALLLCIAGDINFSIRQYGESIIIYYVFATLGCIVVLWCSKRIEATYLGKGIAFLGKHSLTIFCMEILFIREASIIYCKMIGSEDIGIIGGIIGTLFSLIGGTLLSIILHKSTILNRVLFD